MHGKLQPYPDVMREALPYTRNYRVHSLFPYALVSSSSR